MMLAENLQVLRKQNNLSQEELAEKCQVSRQAIAKWESGESVPTIDKLVYLAEYYGVSLDELVGRIVVNKYAKIKEYLLEFAAGDIPTEEDDDEICAIIQRCMQFADCVGLSGEQTIEGLKKIFLYGCEN